MENILRDSRKLTLFMAVFLIILSLFVLVKTVNEVREGRYIGPEGAEAYTLTVSGEGEVFAVPDTATFTFSVVEEASAAEEAQSRVTEIQNEIIAFLKDQGIEESNIKTVGYNVFPRYEFRNDRSVSFPRPEGQRVLVGYEVRHTIEVRAEDSDTVGALLAGVGERGADEVGGISFTIEDEDALKREARQKAIEDAKEKAQNLANDLGVRLGPLVSFSESESPVFFERQMEFDAAEESSAGSPPQIPQGENKIVSNILLVYEIR